MQAGCPKLAALFSQLTQPRSDFSIVFRFRLVPTTAPAQPGLQDALFENVTKALQKLFTLDPSKQRLDSVHIFSNMAHLGRIRIFVRTIRTFLTNLKRHHAKEYDALGEIVLRYDKKSDGAFAVKPTESAKKLVELGDDCFLLVERFKDHSATQDFFTRYSHWFSTRNNLALEYIYTNRGMADRIPGQSIERKHAGRILWNLPVTASLDAQLGYGIEKISNLNLVDGVGQTNQLVKIEVRYNY